MADNKPATNGNPQTAAGNKNNTQTTDNAIKTAVNGGQPANSTGPAVAGSEKTDQVETKVLSEGHTDDAKTGKVTEVVSHVQPTVPEPPAPGNIGVDPAHPSLDTYPSEEAASMAPGIHVDLANVAKPVGVITHDPPPFHRIDGKNVGDPVGTPEEAMKRAQDEANAQK